MSITFSCQNCGKSFTVDDKFAGKKGKCKQCGGMMAIPALAPPPGEDVYGFDDLPVQTHDGRAAGVDEIERGSPGLQPLRPRSASLYDSPKRKQKGSGGGSGVNMIVRIAIGVVLGLVGLGGFGAALKSFRTLALTQGLSSKADLEYTLQYRVDLHKELAKILQGVTDAESAKEASPQANQKFRAITANLRTLKGMKGLQRDLDEIKAKYASPQMQAAQEVVKEIMRIVAIPGAGEALDIAAAADELDREEKGIPGLVQVQIPPDAPAPPPVVTPPGLPAPDAAPPVVSPAPPPGPNQGAAPGANRPGNIRPRAGNRKGVMNRPNPPGAH